MMVHDSLVTASYFPRLHRNVTPWFGVSSPKQQARMILKLKIESLKTLDGNTTHSISTVLIVPWSLSHTYWWGHMLGHRYGEQVQ